MAIDKINSNALTDSTVVAADIADGTITNAKLAGSIANAKLSNNSITVNGTSVALGASGAIPPVQWQSVVVSDGSTVTTMVAGRGYFVNNTSAAGIVKLPASAAAGDIVQIKDYAGNFGTNNLTIQRNSHKIQGNTNDSVISTNRASLTLVYADATKGWLYANESNVADLQSKEYIAATGGTVTTSGNDKIHTFTGDGNFVVSSVGNPAGGTDGVSYLVIAGGGGAGYRLGGGGGAGGFREGKTPATPYTASPLVAPAGLTVTAQTYPITIGGGGTGSGRQGDSTGTANASGSNSVFSTITSAGGGSGGNYYLPAPNGKVAANGGSGGGGTGYPCTSNNGSGNTPSVSPSQGNDGGIGAPNPSPSSGPGNAGAGGGGAGAVGQSGSYSGQPSPENGGNGGAGVTTEITASPVGYAGGGGGSGSQQNTTNSSVPFGGGVGGDTPEPAANGAANKGGGGGATNDHSAGPNGGYPNENGSGGSGLVVIRYKYQN